MKKMIQRFRRDWRDDRGSVLVLVGLMLGVLVGLGALATDVGTLLWTRRALQNAVDAAAQAGARELPGSQADATAKAYEYASLNGVSAAEVDAGGGISFSCIALPGGCPDGDNGITVRAQRTMPPLLRAAIGLGNMDVVASATAITAATEAAQLVPWGIPCSEFQKPGVADGTVRVQLKVGAQGQNDGNFYSLAYTPGGSDYGNYIQNGYNGAIQGADPNQPIGTCGNPINPWIVNTLPGNQAGGTLMQSVFPMLDSEPDYGECEDRNGVAYADRIEDMACPRTIAVPLIEDQWTDTRGASIPVRVVGFAVFRIANVQCSSGSYDPNSGTGCRGRGFATIEGYFLRYANGIGSAALGLDLNYSGIKGVYFWQ